MIKEVIYGLTDDTQCPLPFFSVRNGVKECQVIPFVSSVRRLVSVAPPSPPHTSPGREDHDDGVNGTVHPPPISVFVRILLCLPSTFLFQELRSGHCEHRLSRLLPYSSRGSLLDPFCTTKRLDYCGVSFVQRLTNNSRPDQVGRRGSGDVLRSREIPRHTASSAPDLRLQVASVITTEGRDQRGLSPRHGVRQAVSHTRSVLFGGPSLLRNSLVQRRGSWVEFFLCPVTSESLFKIHRLDLIL